MRAPWNTQVCRCWLFGRGWRCRRVIRWVDWRCPGCLQKTLGYCCFEHCDWSRCYCWACRSSPHVHTSVSVTTSCRSHFPGSGVMSGPCSSPAQTPPARASRRLMDRSLDSRPVPVLVTGFTSRATWPSWMLWAFRIFIGSGVTRLG